jgi:hypothetical protein
MRGLDQSTERAGRGLAQRVRATRGPITGSGAIRLFWSAELSFITNPCLELPRPKNVVLQQLEQDDMPSESSSDKRGTPQRKPLEDARSPQRPAQQDGPPILNDGPELPRSNDC